jgi:hypothetical protein
MFHDHQPHLSIVSPLIPRYLSGIYIRRGSFNALFINPVISWFSITTQEDIMNFKLCLLSLLSLGMAIFLLMHFILIWIYGRVQIYESNIIILSLEIIMTVFILGFSAFCIFSGFKSMKQNRVSEPSSSKS